MSRQFALALLFATVNLPGNASQPSASWTNLKAWEWTAEQRLTARFNETARNRRIDAYEAAAASPERAHPRASAVAESHPTDIIRGHDHPELFMPFELFTIFIRETYGADDIVAFHAKHQYAKEATAIGLPPEFLETVEAESASFIALVRDETALRQQIYTGKYSDPAAGMTRVHELETLQCRSRSETLRNLRRIYGARLDQFLYSVIAPGAFIDFFKPITAQELRWKEEGCR